MVDRIVPPGSHDGDILIDQFLFLLELPLYNTVESSGASGHHETFSEEPVLHGLLQSQHIGQTGNRSDAPINAMLVARSIPATSNESLVAGK